MSQNLGLFFVFFIDEGVDRVVEHAVSHFYTPPYPNVEHTRTMFDNDIALVQLEKEAPEFMEKIQYRSTPRRLFNCTAAGEFLYSLQCEYS